MQNFRKASGSEDRQHDFNPNPILSMATTILRNNKAHSRDFISYLEQYLQIALGRFEVQVQTLQDLLRVSSSLYKRAGLDQNPATAGRRHANAIVNLMFDTLSEVLRGKGRANPVTLVSLVEVRNVFRHLQTTWYAQIIHCRLYCPIHVAASIKTISLQNKSQVSVLMLCSTCTPLFQWKYIRTESCRRPCPCAP